jgi:hypothetical protein
MGIISVNAFGGVNGGAGVLSAAVQYGGQPNSPASFPQVGGVNTTIKYFAQPQTAANAFILPIPGEYILEGQQFTVRAGGWVYVAGTSPTVALTLAKGGPLLTSAATTVGVLSAASLVTAAYYPFAITATFQGDSNSGIVQGSFNTNMNGVFTANAATTSLTGIAFGTAFSASNPGASVSAPFSLIVGVTFGVSNAANLAQLDQFSLEA